MEEWRTWLDDPFNSNQESPPWPLDGLLPCGNDQSASTLGEREKEIIAKWQEKRTAFKQVNSYIIPFQ
jgi:hypothetical protein